MPWSLNGSEAGGGPYFVTNHHVHGLASIRITRFALENSKHLKIRGKQLILFSREVFQCFSRRSRGKHWDSIYSWKFWNWKFIKPRCNGGHRSTLQCTGSLRDNRFCNVARSEFSGGNSVIVRCHVTSTSPRPLAQTLVIILTTLKYYPKGVRSKGTRLYSTPLIYPSPAENWGKIINTLP